MKLIIRLLVAALLIWGAFKLLLPFHVYPIEHFEYKLMSFLPVSWKFIAVFSRVLIGLLFVAAFLLIFYWQKIKWVKLIAPLMIILPFIINAVFPENFKDLTSLVNEEIPSYLPVSQTEKTLVAYLSNDCMHCRQAVFKLAAAKNHHKNFPEIQIISHDFGLKKHLLDNGINNLSVDSVSLQEFGALTLGSVPKYVLIENGKIVKKYEAETFNYAVLDNLSK